MTMPGKPVIGAGVLRYPQIMSPNFDLANPPASPANSWALLQSGLAYLFGVVLTGGTITGPDYIIDTTGAFFYTGTPAAGNLAVSIVPGTVSITDPTGHNTALPGVTAYGLSGNTSFVQMLAGSPAVLNVGTGDSAETTPGQLRGLVTGSGATRFLNHSIRAARVTGEAAGALAELQLFSPNAGLTTPAGLNLSASDGTSASLMHQVPTAFQFSGAIADFDAGIDVTAGGASVTGGTTTDTLDVTGTSTLSGAVTATGGTAGSPTLVTTDTWHTLGALAAGSGYTVAEGRYQLDTNGFAMVDVVLVAGAATVAGGYSFANSLPAAYRPPEQRSYPMGWNGTVTAGMNFPAARISTAGLVQLQLPALPNNTVVTLTQRVPTN